MYWQKCLACQGLHFIHLGQSHPMTHFWVIAPYLLFFWRFSTPPNSLFLLFLGLSISIWKDLLLSLWLLFFFFRHFFKIIKYKQFTTYHFETSYMISISLNLFRTHSLRPNNFSDTELPPRTPKTLLSLKLRNRNRYMKTKGWKMFRNS